MFTFDGTINLGQVVEVTAFLGGGVVALVRMRDDLKLVKHDVGVVGVRLDKVDREMAKQTEILVSLGQQDARLDNLESQMTLVNQTLLNKASA